MSVEPLSNKTRSTEVQGHKALPIAAIAALCVATTSTLYATISLYATVSLALVTAAMVLMFVAVAGVTVLVVSNYNNRAALYMNFCIIVGSLSILVATLPLIQLPLV